MFHGPRLDSAQQWRSSGRGPAQWPSSARGPAAADASARRAMRPASVSGPSAAASSAAAAAERARQQQRSSSAAQRPTRPSDARRVRAVAVTAAGARGVAQRPARPSKQARGSAGGLAAAVGRARVAGRPTAGARHQREQAQRARGSGSVAQPAAAAHRGVFQRITALFSYMKSGHKHV